MAAITCKGIAFIIVSMTCQMPEAAPTGKAPFCQVMDQGGGKIRPSRRDTRETKERADILNAQYDRDCRGRK